MGLCYIYAVLSMLSECCEHINTNIIPALPYLISTDTTLLPPGQAQSSSMSFCQVGSGPVRFGEVQSGSVWFGQVRFGLVRFSQGRSGLMLLKGCCSTLSKLNVVLNVCGSTQVSTTDYLYQ